MGGTIELILFNVMFQRLCENAANLGSDEDIARARPILKELQAVLQRSDIISSVHTVAPSTKHDTLTT